MMLLSLFSRPVRLMVLCLLLVGSDCRGAPAPLQPAAATLENYLRQADPRAVEEAARQGVKALPLLRQQATHEDYRVRQLVLRCVGRIGDQQAADLLATGLADQNVNVRLTAADELAAKPYPGAAAAILQHLKNSPELIVQEKLALAAGRLTAAQALPVLQTLTGSRDQLGLNVRMALARLGEPKARQSLLQNLSSKEPLKRYETLEQLIYVGDARLLLSAKKLLSDRANALRIGSLRATRYRRVCDQAVETFVAVRQLTVNFPVNPERNYSEQELAQVKGVVK